MPKLQEYVAPSRELRPDNTGYQAFETEGRRIGGMYRDAATTMIAAAKSNAAAISDKAQWPFALFDLQQKFAAKTSTGASGLMNFNTRASSRGGQIDDQFSPRVMPNLYAANLADADNFNNPLSKSLSPAGAHASTLDAEASRLTNTLRGLIGSGDPTGGMAGPRVSPNADAEASANAWGQSISGVPSVPVSSSGDWGVDAGGGSGALTDVSDVSSAPVSDLGGGAFGGM